MNWTRLMALLIKERKQLFREPSNLIIGIFMPFMLLMLFGYGMTMDVRIIHLAIVEQDHSTDANNIISRFRNSKYFRINVYRSTQEGMEAVRQHKADACLFLPNCLSENMQIGDLHVYAATNAANANAARLHENYIRQIFFDELKRARPELSAGVNIKPQLWFNKRNESCFYMVPGVMVLIMAIVGCMLTSLQMAKEYEHGNMESMFATPVSAIEILLAKMLNNFILGITGLLIAVGAAKFIFLVPLEGSPAILFLGSSIFLFLQMAFGLFISSVTKSQFVACQLSLFSSFLPNLLLSGFLWEIPNMPDWVQIVTYLVPGRYYVDFMQSIFLVGNVTENIVRNILCMIIFTAALLVLAVLKNAKQVGT